MTKKISRMLFFSSTPVGDCSAAAIATARLGGGALPSERADAIFNRLPHAAKVMSPLFYPLGSVPGSVAACAGRPLTTHEPGRHRFFVSDVPKIR